MKSFEAGKTYDVNGSKAGQITVTKRTKCYVWITGTVLKEQKRKVYGLFENGLFGLGEHIVLDAPEHKMQYFCFAGHEVE